MISSPIDEIKNKLDVVEVIQNYIKLQKAGANYRALCPFHSEKKPSLFVSPARQIWHCFGCNSGGDIFKFVMQIEGIEFGDALRILAQKAGIELKRYDPKLKTERQRLYEICELATKFFEKQLSATKTGKEAEEYLIGRGINEESIKKWRLGYAPDTWQGLSDFLVGRGYKREEVEKAGLAIKTKTGWHDRFRGRIIFPIFDLNSQIIGFGGRVFQVEDPAKYINTPSTPLYDKSRILYGLDKAKIEIRKKNYCILVEGYTDVIMASQAGFENVVATSGTALTPFQLKILKRYSENLYSSFDMDIAGDSATKRGIDLAQAQGFNIKVITMPEGSDPADIISKNPSHFEKFITEARSILEFYFETTMSRFSPETPEGKKEISKILLPVLKRIPNRIEQSHWVQQLSKKLGTREEKIEEELNKVKGEKSSVENITEPNSKRPPSRRELLEERIASLVLKDYQNLNFIDEECFSYFSPWIQTIFTNLKEGKPIKEDYFVNYLFLKAEVEGGEIEPEKEIRACWKELKRMEVKNQLDEISKDLKKAEQDQDSEKINILIQRFNKLASQLISND